MIVWTYAPGYVSDGGNSVENMKRLTGLDFMKASAPIDPELTLKDGQKTGGLGHVIAPVFSPVGADEVLGVYSDSKPGLVMKRTGQATTVFSGTYRLEVPLLMSLARRAGVHLYSDSSDPVDANDSLVALHARFEGKKTIRLPRRTDVYDVFGGRMIARGVDTFSFDAPLHSSWLFYFADDAETLSQNK